MDHVRNGFLIAIIAIFMGSIIVQMAVEWGFDRELIHYVVTQHFRETGQLFSTPYELIGSILDFEAKGQDTDPTLSKEEAMDVDSESECTSPMTGTPAGFGIHHHDEAREDMSPPSRNVPPVTPIRSLSTPRDFIEKFMGSRIVLMAVRMGFVSELIRYVVTQHFIETGRLFSTLDELIGSILEKVKAIIEKFMGRRIVQMAVKRESNIELICYLVTLHFMKTCRLFSTLDELRESIWEFRAKPYIENFMGSRIVQMAVEMGYHHDLIRYVVTQRFRKTGRLFSTPDGLLESIWEAERQGVDSTLSGGRAMGGQDVASESTSAMSSSLLDSLNINRSSSTVPPVTPVGSLRPQRLASSGNSDPDKQLCKICLDNERNTVFLPCKHLATCSDCAAKVTKCPICMRPITDFLTIYMP